MCVINNVSFFLGEGWVGGGGGGVGGGGLGGGGGVKSKDYTRLLAVTGRVSFGTQRVWWIISNVFLYIAYITS